MELAYADVLQSNLTHPGGTLLNLELPLFFINRADPDLQKTVWGTLQDRGIFYDPSDGDYAAWAVDQIVDFLYREQALSVDMSKIMSPGKHLYDSLNQRHGLVQRIASFDPGAIP
jgi:hypothetical protein